MYGLQHITSGRAAPQDIDRGEGIAVGYYLHHRRIDGSGGEHQLYKEQEIEDRPQHLQVGDVQAQQRWCEREIPVVAMEVASQCRKLCAFDSCIAVEMIDASYRGHMWSIGQGVEEIAPWRGDQQLLPACCLLRDEPLHLCPKLIGRTQGVSHRSLEAIHDVAPTTMKDK